MLQSLDLHQLSEPDTDRDTKRAKSKDLDEAKTRKKEGRSTQ